MQIGGEGLKNHCESSLMNPWMTGRLYMHTAKAQCLSERE